MIVVSNRVIEAKKKNSFVSCKNLMINCPICKSNVGQMAINNNHLVYDKKKNKCSHKQKCENRMRKDYLSSCYCGRLISNVSSKKKKLLYFFGEIQGKNLKNVS